MEKNSKLRLRNHFFISSSFNCRIGNAEDFVKPHPFLKKKLTPNNYIFYLFLHSQSDYLTLNASISST